MSTRRQPDPRPIKGWTVQATCPRCGGILGHVADGRPDPWHSRAIVECTGCGHRFVVQLTIADAQADLGTRWRRAHKPDCPCRPCVRIRARRETAA